MTLQTRLDSLKERQTLTRLKVEKLHVKEEIERLRAQDH
jgi:hypothetical protein